MFSESELGRQVAVDFESNANLNEDGGRPSHGVPFGRYLLAVFD
jgi:hypothetical protein